VAWAKCHQPAVGTQSRACIPVNRGSAGNPPCDAPSGWTATERAPSADLAVLSTVTSRTKRRKAHKFRSRAPAMMTQPLWWRLSAVRRFAQDLADLEFKNRTRLLLVCGTMIRHASPSRTVTATSGSVHGATTWSCLIAPPSFPLVLVAGFLRAGSEAVDLAVIALPTDKNLSAAATTQKQSARHFIGAVRHINPQPSAVSSCLQPPIRSSVPPCSDLSRPSPSGGREDAASLDRPCARRL
jgi:hypothetical protein